MALATVAESRLLAAGRSREQNSAVGRLGGSKYHTANGPPNYQAAKPPSHQATKPPNRPTAFPGKYSTSHVAFAAYVRSRRSPVEESPDVRDTITLGPRPRRLIGRPPGRGAGRCGPGPDRDEPRQFLAPGGRHPPAQRQGLRRARQRGGGPRGLLLQLAPQPCRVSGREGRGHEGRRVLGVCRGPYRVQRPHPSSATRAARSFRERVSLCSA